MAKEKTLGELGWDCKKDMEVLASRGDLLREDIGKLAQWIAQLQSQQQTLYDKIIMMEKRRKKTVADLLDADPKMTRAKAQKVIDGHPVD